MGGRRKWNGEGQPFPWASPKLSKVVPRSNCLIEKKSWASQPNKCWSARARQPERCDSALALQPRNCAGSRSEGETERLEEHLPGNTERLRARPMRGCLREVKKLQHRHLCVGRGASHLDARDHCGPTRVKQTVSV